MSKFKNEKGNFYYESGYFASRSKIVFFLCSVFRLGLRLELGLGSGFGLEIGLFWHLQQNSR